MTMRVCYITMFFPAPSEAFACCDVRALRKLGVVVSVHALRRPFPNWRQMLEERDLPDLAVSHGGFKSSMLGVGLLLLHPGRFLASLTWLFQVSAGRPVHLLKGLALLPRAMAIFAALVKEQPDIVHLFWGHYPSLVGFLLQRYQPQAKLSIFLGAYDLIREFSGSIDVAKNAHVVWTHAHCNVEAIRDRGVPLGKIQVCHRGMDLSAVPTVRNDKVLRRIVTVGRLKKTKGMDRVLRMFSKTVAMWPDATLMVLGGGPEEKKLRLLARELEIDESVCFRGHVPHTEVFQEMAAAEVFVLLTSSPAERLPNVVKEAMACRCLCLVSISPGIEELVADGETGFVLPLNEELFARQLNEIFAHPERFASIADAAERWVNDHFDSDRQMAQYRQTWKELLGSGQVAAPDVR